MSAKKLVFDQLRLSCPSRRMTITAKGYCDISNETVPCQAANCPVFYWVGELFEALIRMGYVVSPEEAAKQLAENRHQETLKRTKRG